MTGLLSDYLRTVRSNIATKYAQGTVLELGCGPAETYRLARDTIVEYHGVDMRADLIEELRNRYPEAHFYVADLDEDRLPEGIEADTILLIALIEHIFNQKHAMREVLRCLAPGGRIVMTTPTPFGNDVVHRLGGAMGLFASSAVDDHFVIYNKKRFGILADEMGLVIERYQRFQLGCNQLVVLRRQEDRVSN